MTIEERIRQQLQDHPIILYMKGVPDNPECGFSARAVAALKDTGIAYTYVNVLGSPFIRDKLPKISRWPTFPQLFIKGELIGGCDIIESMAEQGSLLPALQAAVPAAADTRNEHIISHDEVMQLIQKDYPDARIFIEGEGCDLTVTVISDQFAGQSLVRQQQGVMATLTAPLESGRLHALSVKAFTADQWQAKQAAGKADGLLQIQG